MDTRSKSSDGNMTEKTASRALRAVTAPGLRVAALIIACVSAVFMMSCTLQYVLTADDLQLNSSMYAIDDLIPASDYTESVEFQHRKNALYEILCATATVYLRNCEDGVYKGGEELKRNLVYTLRSFCDIANENNIQISSEGGAFTIGSDLFDYYVSYDGGGWLTNIEGMDRALSREDIENFTSQNRCWYVRSDDLVSMDENYDLSDSGSYYIFNSFNTGSGYYYDYDEYVDADKIPRGWSGIDNYGRYILCYGPYSDMYVFDFDTNDPEKKYIVAGEEPPSADDDEDSEFEDTYSPLEYADDYAFRLNDDSGITVLIAVDQQQLTAAEQAYAKIASQGKVFAAVGVISALICLISCIYLLAVCGYRYAYPKGSWKKCVLIGGWYTELLIMACAAFVAMGLIVLRWWDVFSRALRNMFSIGKPYNYWIISSVVSLLFTAAFVMLTAVVCKFKTHSFIKDMCLVRTTVKIFKKSRAKLRETGIIKKYAKKSLSSKLYIRTWIFIAVMALLFIICIILLITSYYNSYPFPVSLLLALAAAGAGAWFIVTQFKIYRDMERLEMQIDSLEEDGAAAQTLEETSAAYGDSVKLARISDNIRQTVEKQVQSERMKVELVTNVSHDLKTPLTSIISYIDLLKEEDMSPKAKDYVRILENKSEKLKNIVSDVFSLAKATSGVDVAKEHLDAVILLNQVLADEDVKISESGRKLVADIQPLSAPICADGSKLYRVFQNLIDNALSYSMEGTRIFLTVTAERDYVRIEIKNTAGYEMTFTPEEITERFVRGDESRTDGGSGLGLSIAKTFSEACGGVFRIELDGDVFKAVTLFRLEERPAEQGKETEVM